MSRPDGRRRNGGKRSPGRSGDWDDTMWEDPLDALPGGDLDLEHEIRQMGLSATSGAMAARRPDR